MSSVNGTRGAGGRLQAKWSPSIPLGLVSFYAGANSEELKQLIDAGAADIVIVDNQPEESYNEGHIPGAVNFPWVNTIKPPVNLPRNKTLIMYCNFLEEEDSLDMALKLREFGYRNIKLLKGGWLRWEELNYPVERKSRP